MTLDLEGLRRAVELKDVYIVGAEDDTLELLLARIAELEAAVENAKKSDQRWATRRRAAEARVAELERDREEANRWVRERDRHIAELEAERDEHKERAEHFQEDWHAAEARIAELEAERDEMRDERDKWRRSVTGLQARSVAAEAEVARLKEERDWTDGIPEAVERALAHVPLILYDEERKPAERAMSALLAEVAALREKGDDLADELETLIGRVRRDVEDRYYHETAASAVEALLAWRTALAVSQEQETP